MVYSSQDFMYEKCQPRTIEDTRHNLGRAEIAYTTEHTATRRKKKQLKVQVHLVCS